MKTIRTSFNHVKKQFREYLTPSTILQACTQTGYVFRRRKLGPVETIMAFCLQILHGNTACTAVRHWLQIDITDSAYCQARQRVPVKVFQHLLRCIIDHLVDESGNALWNGRRAFLIDGTSFSMPDTDDLVKQYGKHTSQKKGLGFPVSELLVMVHWSTGVILDLCAMPWKQHEQSQVATLHQHLNKGDILVADRGFCSYGHLAQLAQKGIEAVLRVHQKQIIDFRRGRPYATSNKTGKGLPRSKWIRSVGVKDQIVRWRKPAICPKYVSSDAWRDLPNDLLVRELAYRITTPGYRTRHITLVTTLLDSDLFSKEELADLYMIRWRIETNFGDLKTTMGLDLLKCKTADGVAKELLVFAMIFNMVMSIRYRSAATMDIEASRISFIDIL